jgi:hypothetical protein
LNQNLVYSIFDSQVLQEILINSRQSFEPITLNIWGF